MDKIEKALQKLSLEEREVVKELLHLLDADKTAHLDVKKLRGYADIFRVRKGVLRIIYRKDTQGTIFILAIERRGENTYKL
ncbi:MAG: type II toxin-antitoxin system RelE/ParE family toxin [bacterium]|nr:type II toxin-antitoxin system RelE/ParE family toxin [bacterium]MDZ4299436.1 type II toxin-antitoxin system RelE/ParE family toxin [Candidatus Sungbacteria bacterium]